MVGWFLLGSVSSAWAFTLEFGNCALPAELPSVDEADEAQLLSLLHAYRAARPEVFGPTTAPPRAVRAPADFEPKDELHVVFPAWADGQEAAARLIAAAQPEGPVVVHLMFDGYATDLRKALRPWPGAADRLTVRRDLVSSLWIRDFGGLWVLAGGARHLVDGRYHVDCPTEDAWPTLSASHRAWPIYRTDLPLVGGNFLTDGQGTCFTTAALPSRAGLVPDRLAQELQTWLGCTHTVMLEPLFGDETEHVDVMLSLADPHTLLLASADPRTDPDNHRLLERQAARLAALRAADGKPYRVRRVPLAPSVPHPETGAPAVRSYLNLVPFNGVVLVPTYEGAEASQRQALEAIREAFPGRRVVGVPADAFMADGGALHCVTWTVPRAP